MEPKPRQYWYTSAARSPIRLRDGKYTENNPEISYRDLGGIAGCMDASAGNVFTNNKIKNVTIVQSDTNGYKAADDIKITTVGYFVGRTLNSGWTQSGNTKEGTNNVTKLHGSGGIEDFGVRVD